MRSIENSRANVFFAVLCAVYAAAFSLTLPHYGITWDSALGEFYLGDKNAAFLASFDKDFLDYSADNLEIYRAPDQPDYFAAAGWAKVHPEHVWPFGPTVSAFSRGLLHTQLGLLRSLDAQHCFLLGVMLLLFWTVFAFTRDLFGPSAAGIAVVLLAMHPRMWADAHNNIKDVPSTLLVTAVVVLFYRAVTESRRGLFAAAAIVWGLALAAKGNALFVPFIVVPWIFLRRAPGRLRTALHFGAAGVAALGICLAVWPYLWLEFPQHIVGHMNYLLSYGSAGTGSFSIVPLVEAVTTVPTYFLLFFLIGILPVMFSTEPNAPGKRVAVLLFLWLLVPIARVSLPYANDFDGIRHWMEYLVPFSIIAGAGAANVLRLVQPAFVQWAIVGAACAPTLFWIYDNHPNEICFFNSLVGGLPGARERNLPQATDYWGSSYRTGIEWLNRYAEKNAAVSVPVASHIVEAVRKTQLRKDLRLLDDAENTEPGSGYVMYVTREERYPGFLSRLDGRMTPVYSVRVEGVSILKILKLTEAGAMR